MECPIVSGPLGTSPSSIVERASEEGIHHKVDSLKRTLPTSTEGEARKKPTICQEVRTALSLLETGDALLQEPTKHLQLAKQILNKGLLMPFEGYRACPQETWSYDMRLYDLWMKACAPHIDSLHLELKKKNVSILSYLPFCIGLKDVVVKVHDKDAKYEECVKRLQAIFTHLSPQASLKIETDIEGEKLDDFNPSINFLPFIEWAAHCPQFNEIVINITDEIDDYGVFSGAENHNFLRFLHDCDTIKSPFKLKFILHQYDVVFEWLWVSKDVLQKIVNHYCPLLERTEDPLKLFQEDFAPQVLQETPEVCTSWDWTIKAKGCQTLGYDSKEPTILFWDSEDLDSIADELELTPSTHGALFVSFWRQ